MKKIINAKSWKSPAIGKQRRQDDKRAAGRAHATAQSKQRGCGQAHTNLMAFGMSENVSEKLHHPGRRLCESGGKLNAQTEPPPAWPWTESVIVNIRH